MLCYSEPLALGASLISDIVSNNISYGVMRDLCEWDAMSAKKDKFPKPPSAFNISISSNTDIVDWTITRWYGRDPQVAATCEEHLDAITRECFVGQSVWGGEIYQHGALYSIRKDKRADAYVKELLEKEKPVVVVTEVEVVTTAVPEVPVVVVTTVVVPGTPVPEVFTEVPTPIPEVVTTTVPPIILTTTVPPIVLTTTVPPKVSTTTVPKVSTPTPCWLDCPHSGLPEMPPMPPIGPDDLVERDMDLGLETRSLIPRDVVTITETETVPTFSVPNPGDFDVAPGIETDSILPRADVTVTEVEVKTITKSKLSLPTPSTLLPRAEVTVTGIATETETETEYATAVVTVTVVPEPTPTLPIIAPRGDDQREKVEAVGRPKVRWLRGE